MGMTTLKQLMSGEVFRHKEVKKQYPMVLLTVALIFAYILQGFLAGMQQHHATDLRKEVRELRFEYLTVSAQLVESTRQSNVAAELKRRGSKLEPNKTPVVRVR